MTGSGVCTRRRRRGGRRHVSLSGRLAVARRRLAHGRGRRAAGAARPQRRRQVHAVAASGGTAARTPAVPARARDWQHAHRHGLVGRITIDGTRLVAVDGRPHPRSGRHRVPGSGRPVDRPHGGRRCGIRPARPPLDTRAVADRRWRKRWVRSTLTGSTIVRRTISPPARSAASAWPACSPARRACCCSTNPHRAWIPRGRRALAGPARTCCRPPLSSRATILQFVGQVCTRAIIVLDHGVGHRALGKFWGWGLA